MMHFCLKKWQFPIKGITDIQKIFGKMRIEVEVNYYLLLVYKLLFKKKKSLLINNKKYMQEKGACQATIIHWYFKTLRKKINKVSTGQELFFFSPQQR